MTIDPTKACELIEHISQINKIRQGIGNQRYTVANKPKVRTPVSHNSDYVSLGERINMPSLEIEFLIQAIFDNPDDADLEEIRRMLLIAKLRFPQASIKFSERQQAAQAQYDDEVKRYETAVQKTAALQAQLDALIQTDEAVDLKEEWAKIIDSYTEHMDQKGWFVDVFEGDMADFFAVLKQSSKHIRTERTEDGTREQVVGEWPTVRNKLHLEHITGVFRKWIKFKQEKAEAAARAALEAETAEIVDGLLSNPE